MGGAQPGHEGHGRATIETAQADHCETVTVQARISIFKLQS